MATERTRQTQQFSVTFQSRPVEAFRGDWFRLEDSFSDLGIAFDFVRGLEPRCGPSVVRATAVGGASKERARISGDWFCDDQEGYFGRNVRLLPMAWSYSRESKAWAAKLPTVDAWETCEHGAWMLNALGAERVGKKLVTAAMCAVARRAFDAVGQTPQAALAAVVAAEAWTKGKADIDRVRSAIVQSTRDADQGYGDPIAHRAAQQAALNVYYSYSQPQAVADTAIEAGADPSELADVVRSFVPTVVVLRASRRRVWSQTAASRARNR